MKQVLSCGNHEGNVTVLTISGQFLAAGTDLGHIKMWDLSRRYVHTAYCMTQHTWHTQINYGPLCVCTGRLDFMREEICLEITLIIMRLCPCKSTPLAATSVF